MNGTSAAAPMVAGSLALVLEACPTLSWRDVKYLIAKTAIKVDPNNTTWQTNSAGLHHSVDYGFGLINTQGMISECQNNYQTLPRYSKSSQTINIRDVAIPDNNRYGRTIEFNVRDKKSIEWIGVTIDSDHSRASDLEIYLTSPSGTTSRIMLGNNSGGKGYDWALSIWGFRYGSVAFMNEESDGKWKLRISDIKEDKVGKITSLKFEVFGH
jgi:kexin